MSQILTSPLQTYGILFLLVVSVLEGAMLLYFAPSEALVPAAILVLGKGTATVTAVVLTAVAGATIGQYLLFRLSKNQGRDFLIGNRWIRVAEERLERLESAFERFGHVAIPASNTMLFTRGMLTVPAGLSEMRDSRFVLHSATGTLIFQSALALLTLGLLPSLTSII